MSLLNKYSANEICIIDVEATGLSVESHPIEVGFVSLSGDSDSFLINPSSVEHWDHWDYNAQDLHGISRDMCIRDGLTVIEAAERLNSQLGGCLAISDAAGHDRNWIDMIFDEANQERLFEIIDLRDYINLTGQHPNKIKGFRNVKKRNRIPHRAEADCIIILRAATSVKIFKDLS